MADERANPLLSGQSSDSGLQVILHPLPILNISDLITRSGVRGQAGPIVVALLGRQSGLGVTVEESFDCKVTKHPTGEASLDEAWFDSRLEQMRLVHKQPQLELVGWGTLLPEHGPTPEIVSIHNLLLSKYNDSAILLGFHPETVLKPVGGKLPITLYESTYEAEGGSREAQADGEDKEMKDGDTVPEPRLRFHELPYSIETGEAEMIGMAFVHKGAANATAAAAVDQKAAATETNSQGKRPQEEEKVTMSDNAILSHEEQDLIAALSSKKNAIQMLKKRIDLFIAYLQRLPIETTTNNNDTGHLSNATNSLQDLPALPATAPSSNVLRAIQALKTNVTLLTPGAGSASQSAFATEILREANDVHIVSLLGDVLQSLDEVREVGRQFGVVDSAKAHKMRTMGDYGGHGGAMASLGASGLSGDLAYIIH